MIHFWKSKPVSVHWVRGGANVGREGQREGARGKGRGKSTRQLQGGATGKEKAGEKPRHNVQHRSILKDAVD